MKLFELFSNDLGVDLGSSNVLINMDDKGIIVREPSVQHIILKIDQHLLLVGCVT